MFCFQLFEFFSHTRIFIHGGYIFHQLLLFVRDGGSVSVSVFFGVSVGLKNTVSVLVSVNICFFVKYRYR